MKFLSPIALSLLLAGCISFNSSKAPPPDFANACANREQPCRDVCGDAGVQAYSCSARPGEGIDFKCECRKPGRPL